VSVASHSYPEPTSAKFAYYDREADIAWLLWGKEALGRPSQIDIR